MLRIGRAADNDIIVSGQQSATASIYHLEITGADGRYRVRDVGSTNGTFVDGEQITDAELRSPSVIRLGNNGPEFAVTTEHPEASELDRTLVIPAGIQLPAAASASEAAKPAEGGHESLLSEAVQLARRARAEGRGDQTLMLMRDVLSHALRRNSSRFRLTIVLLVAALLGTGAFSFWKLSALRHEKLTIDARIRQIEIKLEKDETPQEAERLISELSTYQDEARSLERNVLYRYAVRQQQNFITNEIRAIMSEFGAETYSVPPEFEQGVIQYIERYRGPGPSAHGAGAESGIQQAAGNSLDVGSGKIAARFGLHTAGGERACAEAGKCRRRGWPLAAHNRHCPGLGPACRRDGG